MRLRLQHYNLTVSYTPGKDMYIADFLSRAPLPYRQTDRVVPENVFALHMLSEESELCEEFENVNAADFFVQVIKPKNV